MAKECAICGKGKMKGNLVSHSNRKTNRHYKANIQKVKIDVDGTISSEYVCTKCMKTAK